MRRLLGVLLVVAVVGCGSKENVGDPKALVEGRASLDPVAALEKLEARIERNERGEVIGVDLSGTQVSDAELAHLKELASLQVLHLFNTQIGDTGLIHLQGMTNLQELGLGRTRITDEGLIHLEGLTSLHTLDFSWCRGITGAGLEHLKELTSLKDLSLYKTQVSDAGLVHLKGMTNLENLALPDLGTSEAGVAELQKVLTKCEINRLDF